MNSLRDVTHNQVSSSVDCIVDYVLRYPCYLALVILHKETFRKYLALTLLIELDCNFDSVFRILVQCYLSLATFSQCPFVDVTPIA